MELGRGGTYGLELQRTVALSQPGSRSGFSFSLGRHLHNLGAISTLSSRAARGSGARRGPGARGDRLGHAECLRPPAREQSPHAAWAVSASAAAGSTRRAFGSAAARSPARLTEPRGPRPARSAPASRAPPPLRHLPPARRPSRSLRPGAPAAGERPGSVRPAPPNAQSGSRLHRPSGGGAPGRARRTWLWGPTQDVGTSGAPGRAWDPRGDARERGDGVPAHSRCVRRGATRCGADSSLCAPAPRRPRPGRAGELSAPRTPTSEQSQPDGVAAPGAAVSTPGREAGAPPSVAAPPLTPFTSPSGGPGPPARSAGRGRAPPTALGLGPQGARRPAASGLRIPLSPLPSGPAFASALHSFAYHSF